MCLPSSLLNKTFSLLLSLSHLCFFSSHTHPHTILSIGKHQPIQLVAFSPLNGVGRSITWFDGSYYRPAFSGQEAGIFIVADKGSSKRYILCKRKATSHRCDLWSFFFLFREMSNMVCYSHLWWKTFNSHCNFKSGVHFLKMNPQNLDLHTRKVTGLGADNSTNTKQQKTKNK